MQALAGIADATLEGDFGMGQALQRGTQAGGVHKGEHAVQTLVGRANQKAGGVVEVHHASGVAVNAHLVLQRATGNTVALADFATGIGQELGHDKQGDALGAFWCVRQAGQYDMYDVFCHVVLTGRNENLGAAHLVAAVRLRLGLGAQQAQVGTAMGFGQAHGAGPLSRYQLSQISGLLLFGTMGAECVHRAM